jgi:hypothetical protein
MSKISEEIKERRSANTEQTLMMLNMVPLSDTDTKYSLLSSASHYLNDSRIIEKWIDLIAGETDTRLKADMLQRLSSIGLQQIPDKTRFIELLSASLQQDESRDIILPLLGRFSITDQQARQKLISFYQQQDNADIAGLILSWLLIPLIASPEDLAFYTEILDKADETNKLLITNRLLLQDQLSIQQIEKLLKPEEPLSVKEMVLGFCFDRSIVPEEALSSLILSDKHPQIRIWCIQLLAVHGISTVSLTQTILHALTKDPDAAVRQAALKVFEYSITLTPEIIHFLHEHLAAEKDTTIALQLLHLLEPYAAKSELFVDLLNKGLKTVLAVRIYEILGKLVPQRFYLFEKFLTAYEQEQHEDCKAAILKSITAAVSFGNDLNDFYLKALDVPSVVIKEWGIQGILQIPLTKENTAVVAAAAPVLLHTGLNRELRSLLAKKISCIPQLPSDTVQIFIRLLDHETDARIKGICTTVQENAISSEGADNINWEQWLHKADVAHDLSSIFPYIWMYYQDNPVMAKNILWSALNPANSNALYAESVSDVEILRFLSVNNGSDDNLSNYALNKLLNADLGYESSFGQYLLVLKSNPAYEGLKEGLWILLEKRSRYINLILLDQINMIIWGNELESIFRKRMLQQNTAAGIIPYLSYLAVNCTWLPAPELLKSIVHLPFIREDRDASATFKDTCRKCGLDVEELFRIHAQQPTEEGPGFAD